MQTFLPYPKFIDSARCLDYRRLGKQRVEASQLLSALSGEKKGWVNHPACKMWRGFEPLLHIYKDVMIKEWIRRGYKNTMPLTATLDCDIIYPAWLGDPDFHASHRSNLLRKDPVYYGGFGWSEPDDLPYIWPI